MNQNESAVGYLTVRVSTARGAIPIEGADVNIRMNEKNNSSIIYSLRSGGDGKTPTVSLPTPPRENSATPNGGTAYSTYNVDVFKEGYLPLYFHGVPVFPSVISVQPAVLVPKSSLTSQGDSGNVTEAQGLEQPRS